MVKQINLGGPARTEFERVASIYFRGDELPIWRDRLREAVAYVGGRVLAMRALGDGDVVVPSGTMGRVVGVSHMGCDHFYLGFAFPAEFVCLVSRLGDDVKVLPSWCPDPLPVGQRGRLLYGDGPDSLDARALEREAM